MKRFPSGKYGRQSLRFFPAPYRAPLRSFAALVFPWSDGKVLLCDIINRGWCIPSGRVEPEETSEQAALREAVEEAGAILSQIQYIGCYQIQERSEVRWADCFTATVSDFTEISSLAESRGRRLCTVEELPEVYHEWNPLIECVFHHALEVSERRSPAG